MVPQSGAFRLAARPSRPDSGWRVQSAIFVSSVPAVPPTPQFDFSTTLTIPAAERTLEVTLRAPQSPGLADIAQLELGENGRDGTFAALGAVRPSCTPVSGTDDCDYVRLNLCCQVDTGTVDINGDFSLNFFTNCIGEDDGFVEVFLSTGGTATNRVAVGSWIGATPITNSVSLTNDPDDYAVFVDDEGNVTSVNSTFDQVDGAGNSGGHAFHNSLLGYVASAQGGGTHPDYQDRGQTKLDLVDVLDAMTCKGVAQADAETLLVDVHGYDYDFDPPEPTCN